MTLVPAYGRDYTSQKQVKQAFADNLDFVIADVFDRYHGKPVNREQLTPGQTVTIRYAKLTKVMVLTV